MFSFVLLDESVTPSRIIAARDPIGITTLYQGWHSSKPGTTWFSSELKSLVEDCDEIRAFPPGHVYDSADASTTRYYQPAWWDGDADGAPAPTTKADLTLLRETLEAAVRKRLMSEVPFGVLLSGGLDSSLIAAIASRETERLSQKHYEARQRKLKEHRSGPPTPNNGLIEEYGELQLGLSRCSIPDAVTRQRLSYPGRSCTRSQSGSRTRQT
jgi:asparagine synthase (glutamine-hydrolysing)